MRVFPFKSLAPAEVGSVRVLESGALQHDREYAFFDARASYVNGKRDERIHALDVTYDRELTTARFTSRPSGETFAFAFGDEPADFERWLERHFERQISVRRDAHAGFPDDMRASGPTIVSTATLATVAGWFPELDTASVRDRLRANIEIDGVPAFWEDRLFGDAGDRPEFRIGTVTIGGSNPCARCVVPSRDARTGVPTNAFAKTIAERRAATLPPWANRARFDHYYRLAVNTNIAAAEAGKTISVFDTLEVDEPVEPANSRLRRQA